MDQADMLREIVKKKENRKMITVFSGKGGVGKTFVVTNIYKYVPDSLIIDADANSPYFWAQNDEYSYVPSFDLYTPASNIEKKIEGLKKEKTVIVDAGTGYNSLNKYFIDKSDFSILIVNNEEMSLLNALCIIKNQKNVSAVYFNYIDKRNIRMDMEKVRRYILFYGLGKDIKCFCSMSDLLEHIKKVAL